MVRTPAADECRWAFQYDCTFQDVLDLGAPLYISVTLLAGGRIDRTSACAASNQVRRNADRDEGTSPS
jgi:hypothetical protein